MKTSIESGNLVKYVGDDWTGITPIGQVIIVSQALGIKVLWDNVDWAYWYHPITDLEVISEDEYRRLSGHTT